MKEQKGIYKILYIIIAIIIIIGAIVCWKKGFNIELMYSNRQEIVISNHTGLDTAKIEEIAKSVLQNRKVQVQETERFGNSVEIVSTSISEEEKEIIVNKINEEYGDDISNDDIDITTISNTRIRDTLKPYILPGIIAFIVTMVYFIIVYRKIGLKKVLLKGIFVPIIVELFFYSVIAITRIPYGRIVNAIAIGLYIISIYGLTTYFQKEKENLLENDKKEVDE